MMTTKLPFAFSPETLAALAKPAATYDSRNAELVPGVEGRWQVVEVYPGAERKVADEMIVRRFGIYLPEFEETIVRRGRKIDRTELMFPGYIFVFVWDAVEHRSRIEAIGGVLRLVMDVNGVPLGLTDDEIDLIRTVENQRRPLRLQEFSVEVEPRKKRRRRRKRIATKILDEIIATRPWSAFCDGLMAVDSEVRNQTLQKALGLRS